jgi:hypothetical protein
MMDPSYILASDQRALKLLSEQYGRALAFVVESASYCASFECYERGQLRRYIAMLEGDVKTEGETLPEEKGIDVNNYYMYETDYLMRALTSAFLLLPMPMVDMPNSDPLAPYERLLSGFVVLGVIWFVLSVIMDSISH